jgi:dihydroflavonol-4-reductase
MALVLVTGGSGFIGHHLVEALRARGQRVRVLDVRAPAAANTEVEHVHGSVLDGAAVDAAVAGVDQVYHLAGLPGMWVANKQDFHEVNCRGTEIVLAAAMKRGVSRFLHCSTESILFPYSDLNGAPQKKRCSRSTPCPAPIRARSRSPSTTPQRPPPAAFRS